MIKNPNACYYFGASKHAAKLKLLGPDINCVVLGAGHSLSKNPRRFGLLVSIRGGPGTIVSYARVEVVQVSAAYPKA